MWNPDQYLRFQAQRDRPFHDLVARVPGEPRRIVDLGCGTGHLTATLLERWPSAQFTGMDSSAEMLDKARAHARPGLNFEQADIARWVPEEAPDLLISNAALQWLPDHAHLIPHLGGLVADGGTLAFQVPGNFDSPSHTLLQALQRSPEWAPLLADAVRDPGGVLSPEEYAALLAPDFVVDAWETTYLHLLPGEDAVLEWTRGTALRPTLARLGAGAPAFEAEYAARLRTAYPRRPDGLTPFPFRRVFVVATRG